MSGWRTGPACPRRTCVPPFARLRLRSPPWVPQLVYVGLRDIDDQERKLLRQLNIKAFTMQHVDKFGIGKVRV